MNVSISPSLAPESPQYRLIESARAVLARDAKVAAAWVGGSIAEGTADRWSDVDLRLAVAESDLTPTVMAAMPRDSGGEFTRCWDGYSRTVRREPPRHRDVRRAGARGPGESRRQRRCRGPRSEAVAPLIDPRRSGGAVCRRTLRTAATHAGGIDRARGGARSVRAGAVATGHRGPLDPGGDAGPGHPAGVGSAPAPAATRPARRRPRPGPNTRRMR